MDDLISRQAAIEIVDMLFKKLSKDYVDMMGIGYNHAVGDAIAILKGLPSAERRGRWIDLKCDQCGQVDMSKPNYCPNCGARMEGENERT